jgi:uncharacterized membrane protein YphA (DoxX/SURF4 family)
VLVHNAGFLAITASALLAARIVIAITFIRAGIIKLMDLADFRLAITNYEIVPAGMVKIVALAVPAVEVTAGLLLLFGVLPGVVAALLATLLAAFSVAMIINLARGREFDCGCGGTAPQVISWRHVARNAALATCLAVVALFPLSVLLLAAGPEGPFPVHAPQGAGIPVLLTSLLCLLLASLLRIALTVLRSLQGQFR